MGTQIHKKVPKGTQLGIVEGDEKNREIALGHILLNSTGKGYASETKTHPKPHLIVEQSYALSRR